MVYYDPLPFTQGEIVAINPKEKWYDLKIDEGYRKDRLFLFRDLGGDLNFHFFDPETRNPSRNADTISPKRMEFIADDLLHIEPTNLDFEWNNIQLGDLAATSHIWTAVAVRCCIAHIRKLKMLHYTALPVRE